MGACYGSPLTRPTLPGGNYIQNAFDASKLLTDTWLKKSDGTVLDHHGYTYDLGFNRNHATRGAGQVHLDYLYDPIGQLTNALAYDTGDNSTPRLNEKFGFAYDKAGNLKGRSNGALSQQFFTDALDQLASITRGNSMTVAGALTLAPQTNSVTINGVGARGYSDGTFATTSGVSLVDGANTFTTRLRNSAGQTLTKTLTQNLPVSVSYTYDYDGNMTGDGVAALVYDDADRLVSVTVNRAWRVEYAYDGLWRRRKNYQYGWTGSSWSLTNATIYVCDRMLPIQERSGFNNHVHVTYTRGLDLSGSFQGAGGIGGLLARTDTNANSALYFADGAGNITTLINSSGVRQASYLYDPFGNLLAMSGPLAAPNHYRFSTKEVDPLSGDYYFGYRFYTPNLQRWRNADPIGLAGGLNMHRFVFNNPLGYVDPLGLEAGYIYNSDGGMTLPNETAYAQGSEQFWTGWGTLGIFSTPRCLQGTQLGIMPWWLGGPAAAPEEAGGLWGWLKNLFKKKCPKAAEPVELRPYGGPGGGHHVPAKSAFRGAPGYDVNKALAVPNEVLTKLKINHDVLSGAQQTLYRDFAASGASLTWDAAQQIESQALIQAGMDAATARATVQRAIQALKDAGVSGPTRIPWGGD